jgi:transposase-like protein
MRTTNYSKRRYSRTLHHVHSPHTQHATLHSFLCTRIGKMVVTGSSPINKRKRPDLTNEQRQQIISCLLEELKPGGQDHELKRGAIVRASTQFDVNTKTIGKIWTRAKESRLDPLQLAFRASPRKKGRCGTTPKYSPDELREAIKALPAHQKRSIRTIATALSISKSTVGRLKVEHNIIVRHSNADKPLALLTVQS